VQDTDVTASQSSIVSGIFNELETAS